MGCLGDAVTWGWLIFQSLCCSGTALPFQNSVQSTVRLSTALGWGAACAMRPERLPAVALPGVGWHHVSYVLGFLAVTSLRMPGGAGGRSAVV